MKCQGGYRRSPSKGSNTQHDYTHLAAARVSFAAWAKAIDATAVDRRVIGRALERYGMRDPSPDDILEAHTAGDQQRYGQLFHACVLLAHESSNPGRMGSYNLAPAQRKRHRHTTKANTQSLEKRKRPQKEAA